jgi:hypothetical protein
MILSNYELLAYLHDSVCIEIRWDLRSANRRDLHLFVEVDKDAGYPLWNGKRLTVTLTNTVAARFVSWGFVRGDENIDSWWQDVSSSLEYECERLAAQGLLVSRLRNTITFRSGSTIELACEQVMVEERVEGA